MNNKIKVKKNLKFELLKPDKLIKENNLQEITNPTYFIREGVPTPDGLLSNDIFGISKNDRSNIFAYIQLSDYYLHPLVYLVLKKLDKNIDAIVYEEKKFILDDNGYLVEDDNGSTGLDYLKSILPKLNFKGTGAKTRDENIIFIKNNLDSIFIKECIVIPAYYRDVNSTKDGIGVGDVNKLYNSLILSVKTILDIKDFGSIISGSIKGRIQNILLELYNWFILGPVIEGTNKRTGNNLTSKYGIIRRAVMSKTTTYGSRLVLSGTDNNVEHYDDYDIDVNTCGIGMSSLLVNFYPYVVFYLRRFFDSEFSTNKGYPVRNKKDGSIEYLDVKDPEIQFSDDVIKTQINRFIKGFSNRFIPIEIELENGRKINMKFKGYSVSDENTEIDYKTSPLINRPFTWCDLFYITLNEIVKDKTVELTRFPIENHFNQYPNKIFVLSTIETEPIYIDKTLYKKYPKIRIEDIGGNTSNKFYNGLQMCECNFDIMDADTDGDQLNIKPIFSIEANDELEKFMNSKSFYIGSSGINVRIMKNESIQSIYGMTKRIKENNTTPSENILFA